MSVWLPLLTRMARDLSGRPSLEEALTHVVDRTAEVLETTRASLRLLDPSRTRLLATCRFGAPVHDAPQDFALGEGLIGWIAEHGTTIRSANADADPRFVTRAGMNGRLGSFLGVPLMTGSVCMGVISAVASESGYFTEGHEEVLTLIAAIASPYVEIARLSRLSVVDPLTGALNRRGGDEMFPEITAPNDDDGPVVPLSVALADIDYFKRVNDEFGHAIGDEVLKRTANVLSKAMRRGDAIIRHGGEEFLLVLPGVGLPTALRVAERARQAIEKGAVDVGHTQVRVTVSIGVAERRSGEDRDALVARADAAMYEAKRGGRNRTEPA